ncbi:hypothetical protein FBU30_006135 [Linnemannia zychae]|nr:hypothetical protein FBU30_006135 [Linnemannia zychae]
MAADLAPTEVVSNLPIKVFFSSKVKENDPVECVICLEEFEDETELRVLPCRHEYHVACIDSWLTKQKKFCPICKRDICAPSETTPLLSSSGTGSSTNNNTRGDSFNSHSSTRRSLHHPPRSSSSGLSGSPASSTGSSSRPRPQRQPRGSHSLNTALVAASSAPAAVSTGPSPSHPANRPQSQLNSEEDVLRRV